MDKPTLKIVLSGRSGESSEPLPADFYAVPDRQHGFLLRFAPSELLVFSGSVSAKPEAINRRRPDASAGFSTYASNPHRSAWSRSQLRLQAVTVIITVCFVRGSSRTARATSAPVIRGSVSSRRAACGRYWRISASAVGQSAYSQTPALSGSMFVRCWRYVRIGFAGTGVHRRG